MEGNDIDLVVVTKDVDVDKAHAFKEAATKFVGKKVSVCPMSMLMYKAKCWNGKVARMVYKGITVISNTIETEPILISEAEMLSITRRGAIEEINTYLKTASDRPEKKDKMFELMTQLAVLLTK